MIRLFNVLWKHLDNRTLDNFKFTILFKVDVDIYVYVEFAKHFSNFNFFCELRIFFVLEKFCAVLSIYQCQFWTILTFLHFYVHFQKKNIEISTFFENSLKSTPSLFVPRLFAELFLFRASFFSVISINCTVLKIPL